MIEVQKIVLKKRKKKKTKMRWVSATVNAAESWLPNPIELSERKQRPICPRKSTDGGHYSVLKGLYCPVASYYFV